MSAGSHQNAMAGKNEDARHEAERNELLSHYEKGREYFQAALGIAAEAKRKGEDRYQYYVAQGQEVESSTKEEYEKVVSKFQTDFDDAFDAGKSRARKLDAWFWSSLGEWLHRFGFASRDDVLEATDKVEKLIVRIRTLTDGTRKGKSHAKATRKASIEATVS